MKSRYLINLALIILAAGLYWFVSQEPHTSEQQTISTVDQHNITNIAISRAGRDTIILQKTASNWQLSQPLQAPANITRVKLLLSVLDATSHSQLAHPDDMMLKQLGLNQTHALLQLNEHSFQFGDIEAISKRRYLLHNGTIHLLDDTIMPLLKANAASFIDNKLLPLDKPLSRLSMPMFSADQTLSADNITITQHNGRWTSEQIELPSDQLAVLIDAWRQAQALQVLPLNMAKLPQTKPLTISFWHEGDSEAIEFELQSDDTTLYINNISQQLSYYFPIALMQQLLPTRP